MMLIGFKVSNFRSFADAQNFTFVSSSDRTNESTHCVDTGMTSIRRLSKVALIFGANGSGKSNLIYAIARMRDMVLRSSTFSESEFAACYNPFRLGTLRVPETSFQIDVLIKGVRYRYSFSFDGTKIRTEQLLVFVSGKSQRWFQRQAEENNLGETWAPFSQHFSGPRSSWRDATRPQCLFLSVASQLNGHQLAPLYEWFNHGMEIITSSETPKSGNLSHAVRDDQFKTRLLWFLREADVRVFDVRAHNCNIKKPENSMHSTQPSARQHSGGAETNSLQFLHGRQKSSTWLDSAEESSGIQRLALLFGPLTAAIEQGKLLLFDEFDLSLHPLVARYLISLVLNPGGSSKDAQVLMTSHNTTLMDVSVLRRDEIWVVSLNAQHASELISVWRSAQPPRKAELIGKSYLKGRYGGIPEIGSLTK